MLSRKCGKRKLNFADKKKKERPGFQYETRAVLYIQTQTVKVSFWISYSASARFFTCANAFDTAGIEIIINVITASGTM